MKRFNYRAISLIRELVSERGQQAFFLNSGMQMCKGHN